MLENSGVAWPNPGMWYQPRHPYYDWASPAQIATPRDTELHAHSPRRTESSVGSFKENSEGSREPIPSLYGLMPPPPTIGPGNEAEDLMWCPMVSATDPFIGNGFRFMHNRYAIRSNGEDQIMPNYSRSITPNSGNDSLMHEHRLSNLSNNEQSFEEIINQLNPRRVEPSGNAVSSNIRIDSAATTTPPLQKRPSNVVETRVVSYPSERPRAVSMIMKDPLALADRSPETAMRPSPPEDQLSLSYRDHVPSKIPRGPASEVKSRKEGNASELDIPRQVRKRPSNGAVDLKEKENSKPSFDTTIESSDGKRKRAGTISGSQAGTCEAEVIASSPTKKICNKKIVKDQAERGEKATDDIGFPRVPLESLYNV